MLKNPLLQKAQEKVEETVTDQASYDKILKALTTTIYNRNVFEQLSHSVIAAQGNERLQLIADGIVGLLGTLAQQARGTMPPQPATQAGFSLLLDALDFCEQAGLLKVDEKVLEDATKAFVESILPRTGVTPQKLQAALSQVQQILSDPQRLEQIKAAHTQPSAAPQPKGGM